MIDYSPASTDASDSVTEIKFNKNKLNNKQ